MELSTIWAIVLIAVFSIIIYILKSLRDVYFTKEKSAVGKLKRVRAALFYKKKFGRLSVEKLTELEAEASGLQQDIKRAGKAWHLVDALLNGTVIVILVYACFGISWWLPILLFMSLSIRWIVVDAAWNLFAGKNFFYKGTTSVMDQAGDNQKKSSQWIGLGIKIFLLAASFMAIFFYYKSL